MDPKIPFLEAALDPQQALSCLKLIRSDIQHVSAATLVRHKPGRRALIAYDLETAGGPLALLGKIRAKGTDYATYHLQQALWNQGFAADSPDGYCVPEPVGIIPDWRMCLQRRVPGVSAAELLPTPRGVPLARRLASLADKLHCTPVPTLKTHTLADELRILHERLPQVSQRYPHWRTRIERVLSACDALASILPSHLSVAGIHRDFYSDQVLVDGDRLWLVDLDLYCQGHPALDIGNFIAHITEQSLRQLGDPNAMADRETALREAFVQASSPSPKSAATLRGAIEIYAVLTLVRHIHISTRISARQLYTQAILALCETRLQALAYPKGDIFLQRN